MIEDPVSSVLTRLRVLQAVRWTLSASGMLKV